jgi:hypothetical protein
MGPHNFFLNMIASAHPNKRRDRYGGDLKGRLTLARYNAKLKKFGFDETLIESLTSL